MGKYITCATKNGSYNLNKSWGTVFQVCEQDCMTRSLYLTAIEHWNE